MGRREAIVVTGASGFLGSLVAAAALRTTADVVVLPLRHLDAREAVVARIAAECAAEGWVPSVEDLERLVTLAWPYPGGVDALVPVLRDLGVRDLLHCAGCLSYFNVTRLERGNVELTRTWLDVSRRLDLRRFVFLSTAFSSGFMDGTIPERLHEAPGRDPTDYTRTKREAEWLVARSGVPYVIVRPSIVIGDSRDGRYGGKAYGLYQLWTAFERYLSGSFPPVLHVVAARQSINFLHQDAFTGGFWAAYRDLPDGAVLHLASNDDRVPSMRDLWKLWMSAYGGPREIHLYDRLDDLPIDDVDPRLRLWLDFTAVNSEIASVRWKFQLDGLARLRANGLVSPDATLENIWVAQERFVAGSERQRAFIARYRDQGCPQPVFIAHD